MLAVSRPEPTPELTMLPMIHPLVQITPFVGAADSLSKMHASA